MPAINLGGERVGLPVMCLEQINGIWYSQLCEFLPHNLGTWGTDVPPTHDARTPVHDDITDVGGSAVRRRGRRDGNGEWSPSRRQSLCTRRRVADGRLVANFAPCAPSNVERAWHGASSAGGRWARRGCGANDPGTAGRTVPSLLSARLHERRTDHARAPNYWRQPDGCGGSHVAGWQPERAARAADESDRREPL